jgi:hypothetical protein
MPTYESLSARHQQAKATYEAARAASDEAYRAYEEACRNLSTCIEQELDGWNPNSLSTTLDTAPQYGVVCIVSAP